MWLTCPGSNEVAGVAFALFGDRRKIGLFTALREENCPVGTPGSLRNFRNTEDHLGGATRSAYFLQFAPGPEADEL